MTDTTPPEAPDHYRAVEARFSPSIDPDAGIDVTAFLSTDGVDEDGEVVLPGGCDLGRFSKNGPLMVNHDWQKSVSYYPLPVGQVLWVKARPRGLLGGIKFARGSEMGREVKALVEEDILRGVSVGMRVLEQSAMTRAEADSRPDWKDAFARLRGKVNVIRRWKLLELSVVPIPCNEDALISTLRAKGLTRPAWVARAKEQTVDEPNAPEAATPGAETPGAGPPADATPADDPATKAAKPAPDDDADEPDADADDGPIKKGHFVKCVKGAYKGTCGKVKSMHRSGPVPDVEEDVIGTKESPAAQVQAYKPMGDGHREMDHHFGAKAAHLEKIDDLKPPKRGKAVSPAQAKALEVEILPGEVRTDADLAAERQAAKRAVLTPEVLKRISKSVLDEYCGVV